MVDSHHDTSSNDHSKPYQILTILSFHRPSDGEGLGPYRSGSVDSLEKVAVLHATNQAELIQPTEVVISDTVLEERAEPILSPRGESSLRDWRHIDSLC